ncbi:diacylglycerol/lipid kinase family protein [Subtercola lobariae]|uniref:diacylglycerol/lipid kinase family protein n=1 Tax=Subtercola lobariae TaxID=1588641 RepID=UPI001E5BC6AD|nr:diacylglycerol kinase family protein [Subtercola lobariae]
MTVAGETVPQRHAAVVYNPLKIDAERLKALVGAAEVKHGFAQTDWYETTRDDAGQLLTAEAVRSGASVVMAAGGDGTVRAVAEALRGTSVPLALLAIGTGNLLARNLNLSLNIDEAIELMFTGYDRSIDLGLIQVGRADGSASTHVFLVIAGLGIDAKMIAKTNPGLKKTFGWLAYIDGTMRALPELKAVKMKVSIDKEPWRSVSAHSVMAGNCGLLPGGILLIPDAKPDDGVLDFLAIRPQGALGWVRVWNKVTIENGVLRRTKAGRKLIDISPNVDDVIYRQGIDLRLKLETPQEIQLDGDEFGEATTIHVSVDPGALRVRV